jgi:hypothetical protein
MSAGLRKGWCPHCRAEIEILDADPAPGRNWRIWAIVGGVIALTLAWLGYRFRGHLSSAFGSLADATGGKTIAVLCLALAVFVLVCIFFWMVFPILIYFGLKDLRRRTARLDQTTQVFVQQLAQLSTQQDVAKSESAPEQKVRGTASP